MLSEGGSQKNAAIAKRVHMVSFVVDADFVTYWSTLEARLERDVNRWVKAAVEMSMGQLGFVGAMAMEKFMQRLKAVIQEIVASSAVTAEAASHLMDFSVRSSTVASGSVDGTSSVPTAFGEGVAPSIDKTVAGLPSSSKLKSGENLIRSHEGF